MLNREDFKELKICLNKLIKNFLTKTNIITEEEFLKKIGFPNNWDKIIYYK